MVHAQCTYTAWLEKDYPDLIRPTFKDSAVKHGIELTIPTSGPPVFAKARRLPPDKLAQAKQAFNSMLQAGIVRRSDSAWSSPLHLVKKDDGSWRPCGDFRRLNSRTTNDKYPVPHLQDFSAQLHGCEFFSKIDLVRGYHQIPVAPEDVHKTAVITPFGLFEFLRTPFGLKNAAQSFQRLMDSVCQDLPFAFVYLDDILVASKTKEEHHDHLRQLFDRLQAAGLILSMEKCLFAQRSLRFLGHEVAADGITPTADSVKAITAFPRPATIQELMSFIGMVNFYKRFIPKAAQIMAPLHTATAGAQTKAAGKKKVVWTPERDAAFQNTKSALVQATHLLHFTPGAPLALTTDASDFAVGGVVEQLVQGNWRPLGFYSSKFKPTQTEKKRPLQLEDYRRSATDRELLAAYRSIQHFRYLLEGREFTLFTDHAPLVGMMTKSTDTRSAMQARHLATISEFTTDVRHLSGKSNIVADTLSRVEIDAVSVGIDLADLAAAQRNDPEYIAVQTAITGLNLEERDVGGAVLLGDCSRTSFWPWVPAALRKKIFDLHHGLAHSDVKASVRLIGQRFVWHDLKRDVAKWAKQCLDCQRVKVHRHTRPSLEHLPLPEGCFRHVHVDLVGPLPPLEGHTYLLTAVDRFSRWPEAFPLRSTDAATVAQAFNLEWVSRFGIPEVIISDRGPQFVSSLWNEMAKTLGTSLHRTSAYHPQSNVMVERLHRQLKASLTARLKDAAWIRQLPWVLLGVRAAVKEDLSCSPAEMLYGHQLLLPGQAPQENPPPEPSAFARKLRGPWNTYSTPPINTTARTVRPDRAGTVPFGLGPEGWTSRTPHAPL